MNKLTSRILLLVLLIILLPSAAAQAQSRCTTWPNMQYDTSLKRCVCLTGFYLSLNARGCLTAEELQLQCKAISKTTFDYYAKKCLCDDPSLLPSAFTNKCETKQRLGSFVCEDMFPGSAYDEAKKKCFCPPGKRVSPDGSHCITASSQQPVPKEPGVRISITPSEEKQPAKEIAAQTQPSSNLEQSLANARKRQVMQERPSLTPPKAERSYGLSKILIVTLILVVGGVVYWIIKRKRRSSMKTTPPTTKESKPARTQKKAEKTVQPVSMKNPNYAGFWIRFLAYILDSIIFGVGTVSLLYLIPPFLTFLVPVAIAVLVVYLEGMKGGTPGKLILHLRIVNSSGDFIGIPHAILRTLGKVVSGAILGIGFIMIGLTEKKQGLHDIIAGTYVVKS